MIIEKKTNRDNDKFKKVFYLVKFFLLYDFLEILSQTVFILLI